MQYDQKKAETVRVSLELLERFEKGEDFLKIITDH
jgi:hypothetical protein